MAAAEEVDPLGEDEFNPRFYRLRACNLAFLLTHLEKVIDEGAFNDLPRIEFLEKAALFAKEGGPEHG